MTSNQKQRAVTPHFLAYLSLRFSFILSKTKICNTQLFQNIHLGIQLEREALLLKVITQHKVDAKH